MTATSTQKAAVKQAAKAAKNIGLGLSLPGSGGSRPGGIGGFGPPTLSISAGDVARGVEQSGACDLLPSEFLREACRAASGAVQGITGGGGGSGPGTTMQTTGTECPSGTIKIGNRCVAPGDAFPGGDPLTTVAGGQTVQGSFGLPAVTPVQEQRVRRKCPGGFVLGKDNLCYPRQILPRRSKFRKWRPSPKPKISAAEWKAIQKAERIAVKLKDLTKRHPGLQTAKNR